MKLVVKNFIRYKFFNSLFAGLSIGSVFNIYAPLEPSVFSVGGIVLAVGLLVVAKFYERLLCIRRFYLISLFVEGVVFLLVLAYIIWPQTYQTALLVYAGYQVTFMFGNYLWRAETLIVRKKMVLSIIDIRKQMGYLAGLGFSYFFYRILDFLWLKEPARQIYILYFVLFVIQIFVILFFVRSFAKRVLEFNGK